MLMCFVVEPRGFKVVVTPKEREDPPPGVADRKLGSARGDPTCQSDFVGDTFRRSTNSRVGKIPRRRGSTDARLDVAR